MKVNVYNTINEVPCIWDTLINDNIYLSIDFLKFIEKNDKCKQKYYMVYDDEDNLDTVFMSYVRPKYNMAMFTKFNLSQKMTFIYVPLSVTRPGIASNKMLFEVLEYIKKIKGPKMILNLGDINPLGYAKGKTCPKCIFTNKFSSFDEYILSLRSSYRRRYKKALEKSQGLKFECLENNASFSEEMYECYLQVYNKSKVRIEKLPLEFFRGSFFKIFTLKKENKVIGFFQLIENGEELIFEFVGVDYKYNEEYDTYHRMLLEIVRYGVENNFKTIDFGQTADESKLKLGSEYNLLYAYLHHSNKVLNYIYSKLGKYIEYKPIKIDYNVFKEKDYENIIS